MGKVVVCAALFAVALAVGLGVGLGLKGSSESKGSSSSLSQLPVSGAAFTVVDLNCSINGISLRDIQSSPCAADLACFNAFSRALTSAFAASPALAGASVRVVFMALIDGATGESMLVPLGAPINNLPRRRGLGDDGTRGGGEAGAIVVLEAGGGARALAPMKITVSTKVIVAPPTPAAPPPPPATVAAASTTISTDASTQAALDSSLAPVEASVGLPPGSSSVALDPVGAVSPSASATKSASTSASVEPTASKTTSVAPTDTSAVSYTATATSSPSSSTTVAATSTATPTSTASVSRSSSGTASYTATATRTPSTSTTVAASSTTAPTSPVSVSPSSSIAASGTAAATHTPSAAQTPTQSASAAASVSPTQTQTASTTTAASHTPSGTISATLSRTVEASPSVSATPVSPSPTPMNLLQVLGGGGAADGSGITSGSDPIFTGPDPPDVSGRWNSTLSSPHAFIGYKSETNSWEPRYLIVDTANHAIRDLGGDGISVGVLFVYAGTIGVSGHADARMPHEATFNLPEDAAFVDAETIIVCDTANNLIRVVTMRDGVVTLAGGGSTGGIAPGAADGTGTAATFNAPAGIAIKTTNNPTETPTGAYISDRMSCTIRYIDFSGGYSAGTGVVTTLVGGGGSSPPTCGRRSGFGSDSALSALFDAPNGLAFFRDGGDTNVILFVADTANHAIRTVQISLGQGGGAGGTVTGVFGLPGIGEGSIYSSPLGVAIDNRNRLLFITDSTSVILQRDIWGGGSNAVKTVAGVAGDTSSNPGDKTSRNALSVTLSHPRRISTIEVDQTTQLLVADTNHHKVDVVFINMR